MLKHSSGYHQFDGVPEEAVENGRVRRVGRSVATERPTHIEVSTRTPELL